MHQFEFLQLTDRNRGLFSIIKKIKTDQSWTAFKNALEIFLVILIFTSSLLKTFHTIVTLQVPGGNVRS